MGKMKQNAFMNLPTDVKMMLASGKYSLYTLPIKYASKGAYLLAMSRNDTFFIKEDGILGERAGKLGEVEVDEVIRIDSNDFVPSIKLNIA